MGCTLVKYAGILYGGYRLKRSAGDLFRLFLTTIFYC